MNPRLVIVALVLAVAAVAGGIWWSKRLPGHENQAIGPDPASAVAATPGTAAGTGSTAPPVTPPPAPDPAAVGRSDPAVAPEVLEPVEPLLELNYVGGGGIAGSDAGVVTQSIDELLGGKHAGKSKAQLLTSLHSVQAVLSAQRNSAEIPKDKVLPPESIQALEIEANWLKEQVRKDQGDK
ncbi:MAG TPA: hypothetical protein VK843_04795 [Planctomycetota bacterium]|nr:hypothetical protein [Planctomycetota bacterium]